MLQSFHGGSFRVVVVQGLLVGSRGQSSVQRGTMVLPRRWSNSRTRWMVVSLSSLHYMVFIPHLCNQWVRINLYAPLLGKGVFNPSAADVTCRYLSLSNAQKSKKLWKSLKTCHVGIHWKALTEYFQMSTHLPWFQSFHSFLSSILVDQISHQQQKG